MAQITNIRCQQILRKISYQCAICLIIIHAMNLCTIVNVIIGCYVLQHQRAKKIRARYTQLLIMYCKTHNNHYSYPEPKLQDKEQDWNNKFYSGQNYVCIRSCCIQWAQCRTKCVKYTWHACSIQGKFTRWQF